MNVISYYPTYGILDQILSYSNNYKTINLFIDLRNILNCLFLKEFVINIIESTKRSKFIDTSILESIISFLAFHKKYAIKRGLDINFYFFMESGQSYYHTNIDKNYKSNRKIDDLFGLDKVDKDLFVSVVQNNLRLSEKVINKIPNCKLFLLQNFEADMIPFFLIKNSLVSIQDTCHVIYSNDHDLFQTISLSNNIYQFAKSGQKIKIIKKNEVMSTYLKTKVNIPDEYLPLAMAILGDKGDNVPKVKNIGPKTIHKIMSKLIEMVGGVDNLYQNVRDKKPIFNINHINDKNLSTIIEEEKNNSLISNNLRLVSFEIISEVFKNPSNTEIIAKRNYVTNILNNDNFTESNTMYKALKKGNVEILEEDIDILFSDKNNYDYEDF